MIKNVKNLGQNRARDKFCRKSALSRSRNTQEIYSILEILQDINKRCLNANSETLYVFE